MPKQRRPLLAANWKQNLLWSDIEDYCAKLRTDLPAWFNEDEEPLLDFLICPPLCYLGLIGALLEDSHIFSGAQLVSTHSGGAYTGEVSAAMIADLGCDYVIIGHSERRSLFGDTDELISQRIRLAQTSELVPILCVGEDLETRREGRAESHVMRQLDAQQELMGSAVKNEFVIAYEPVWAIGTGENASEEDARRMAACIREWFSSKVSGEAADSVQILYGGSVKPDNIAAYVSQDGIDGALIGGASLKAVSMIEMIENCSSQPAD